MCESLHAETGGPTPYRSYRAEVDIYGNRTPKSRFFFSLILGQHFLPKIILLVDSLPFYPFAASRLFVLSLYLTAAQ